MASTTREHLATIATELAGIHEQLKKLNGTVAEHERRLAAHDTELALAKQAACHHAQDNERQETATESWKNRIWEVAVKPVLSAAVAAILALAVYGKLAP